MRPSFPALRLLALVALGFVAGACKQPDSILFVTVYGPTSLTPTQLNVTIIADSIMNTESILVAPSSAGETILFPASFTVALDSSHTGPIKINIDAWDDVGNTIGFGSTAMQHIHIGGQTDLSVQLMEGLPPDMPDGGSGGAGGGGGAGGAGGTTGTDGGAGDGGAGKGGSAGTDAGGDAMGLDAATE
jgi:hypothetical protein